MLAAGKHIQSAELEVYGQNSKGELQIIDEFKFEDLLVSSWDIAQGGSSIAANSLSFDFATIEISSNPVGDIDFLA